MPEKKESQPPKQKKNQESKPFQLHFLQDLDSQIYGDYPLIQSTFITQRQWTSLSKICQDMVGQSHLIRARLHHSRVKGNAAFLILRQQFYSIQVTAFKSQSIPKQMIKYISHIANESIVDVEGLICKAQKPIQSTTHKNIQLSLKKIFVVNRAIPQLPLQIQDASRINPNWETENDQQEEIEKKKQPKDQEKKEKQKEFPIVKMKTRLDNRILDLRTRAKQGIFRISSGVCALFRQFLLNNQFIQIHTPKINAGKSQGGSQVFTLKYFDKEACLAQSPQLYKQMLIMSDFERVFEIAPVFRAQNSNSHRHQTQFTMMDLQMSIKESYMQILDFVGEMFAFIFQNVQTRYAKQLQIIREQFPCPPFIMKKPATRITFQEGCKLLKQINIEQDQINDLTTQNQKKLGQIGTLYLLVKQKYQTDFYMLHRYPKSARPFYTMPCKDDDRFTNSYDFFMRGQQITSGAQRIHDPQLLTKKAIQFDIKVQTIKPYVDAFKYGAYPHGGVGIGLGRVVMLFCGLNNIRNCQLFPRDPHRIQP